MRSLERLRTGWQGTYIGIGKSVSTPSLPYKVVMRLDVNDETFLVSRTLYCPDNGAVDATELELCVFHDRLTSIHSALLGQPAEVGTIGESLISYEINGHGNRSVIRLVRNESGQIFVRRENHPMDGDSTLYYETLARRELH